MGTKNTKKAAPKKATKKADTPKRSRSIVKIKPTAASDEQPTQWKQTDLEEEAKARTAAPKFRPPLDGPEWDRLRESTSSPGTPERAHEAAGREAAKRAMADLTPREKEILAKHMPGLSAVVDDELRRSGKSWMQGVHPHDHDMQRQQAIKDAEPLVAHIPLVRWMRDLLVDADARLNGLPDLEVEANEAKTDAAAASEREESLHAEVKEAQEELKKAREENGALKKALADAHTRIERADKVIKEGHEIGEQAQALVDERDALKDEVAALKARIASADMNAAEMLPIVRGDLEKARTRVQSLTEEVQRLQSVLNKAGEDNPLTFEQAVDEAVSGAVELATSTWRERVKELEREAKDAATRIVTLEADVEDAKKVAKCAEAFIIMAQKNFDLTEITDPEEQAVFDEAAGLLGIT